MTQTFKINNKSIQIDTYKTSKFYLSQNKILDNCKCDGCHFYATSFIKENLEIFKILRSMGVDLAKNLSSEPTGVWCIIDAGKFIHCEQVYQTEGKFLNCDTSKVKYENIENGFKVSATFLKAGDDKVDIELIVDKVKKSA